MVLRNDFSKRILAAICCGFCLTACNGNLQDNILSNFSKLEQLRHVRPDSVMDYYDLSGDSLTEFPDLSMYVIRSLDLSHNQLDTIIPERLPLGLEWLDMSHNRMEGKWIMKRHSMSTLKGLDLSHNRLYAVNIQTDFPLQRLTLAYNRLDYDVFLSEPHYLDISYNRNLARLVRFHPERTDTLVCDKKIKYANWHRMSWWLQEESRRLNGMARNLVRHHADSRDSLQKALYVLDMSLRARESTCAKTGRALLLALDGKRKTALDIMRREADRVIGISDGDILILEGIALEVNGQTEKAMERYGAAFNHIKKNQSHSVKEMKHDLAECMAVLYLMDNRLYTVEEAWSKMSVKLTLPDSLKNSDAVRNIMKDINGKDREKDVMTLWKTLFLVSGDKARIKFSA